MNRVPDASKVCVSCFSVTTSNLLGVHGASSDKSWGTTTLKRRASRLAYVIGLLFTAYESLNPNSRNRLLYSPNRSASYKADNARPLTMYMNAESTHNKLQFYKVSSSHLPFRRGCSLWMMTSISGRAHREVRIESVLSNAGRPVGS